MKRTLLSGLIVLLLLSLVSLPLNAVEITDVSEDHWAYDSVRLMVDRGYISLYEGGTFEGTNRISRFELAEILANLLEDLEEGVVDMQEEDIDILRELSIEFRDELVEVAADMELFQDRIAELEEESLVQGEEIAEIYEGMSTVEQEVTDMIDEIARIRMIEDEMEELEERVAELDERMLTMEDDFSAAIAEIEEREPVEDPEYIAEVSQRMESIEDRLTHLETGQDDTRENIESLERQNRNFMLYIGAVALISLFSLIN